MRVFPSLFCLLVRFWVYVHNIVSFSYGAPLCGKEANKIKYKKTRFRVSASHARHSINKRSRDLNESQNRADKTCCGMSTLGWQAFGQKWRYVQMNFRRLSRSAEAQGAAQMSSSTQATILPSQPGTWSSSWRTCRKGRSGTILMLCVATRIERVA